MSEPFAHEALFRGREALDRLARARIALCGAGALGSNLAETLVRQGARTLLVIDMDRVEQRNIGTQVYDEGDVGAYKVEALRTRLFRAAGVEIEALAKRLTAENIAKTLRGAELVVDAFDNAESRRLVTEYCAARGLPCLHLGMIADFGEARWNAVYRVPRDAHVADACAYPLARNLILLLVALGAELLLRSLSEGRQESYTVTLRDLNIQRDEDEEGG